MVDTSSKPIRLALESVTQKDDDRKRIENQIKLAEIFKTATVGTNQTTLKSLEAADISDLLTSVQGSASNGFDHVTVTSKDLSPEEKKNSMLIDAKSGFVKVSVNPKQVKKTTDHSAVVTAIKNNGDLITLKVKRTDNEEVISQALTAAEVTKLVTHLEKSQKDASKIVASLKSNQE